MKIIYSDFDVNLLVNPITHDVVKKTNVNSVRQSLRLLLNTLFYDRLFQPNVGSRLKDLLFSLLDDYELLLAENEIKSLINLYEPRIILNELFINQSLNNEYVVEIRIDFTVKTLNINDTYVYTINKLR